MSKHSKLQLAVLERDGHTCQETDCNKYTLTTHHIISRKYKGSWRACNLISLCTEHHDKAHGHEARKRHLNHLRDTYGYKYTGKLWLQALDEANKDNDT